MMRLASCSLLFVLVLLPGLSIAVPVPRWIWTSKTSPPDRQAYFRRVFQVEGMVNSAELTGVADFCRLTITLNGNQVARVEHFAPRFRFDVSKWVKQGQNVLAVRANSPAGPAALALRLRIASKDGKSQFLITDGRWRTSTTAPPGWERTQAKLRGWAPASDRGPLAPEPWGDHPDSITISALDDYTQWKQSLGHGKSADPSRFFVRPGFQIELLRSARKEEGSWVSLEFDPRGRLIIAREDRGLLRLTFEGKDRQVAGVETINDTLKECRGLLSAHGALYANANESQGLYRLRDTNGDDRFDEVKLLRKTKGGRGHGRNDLALGPDGYIYAIHGDAVEIPDDVRKLPSPLRQQSQKGRRGFILRTDRDGKKWELVTTGMRNPYGIAFNPDGEMFTYDADAEYDTGAPWYRPTRVLHLLPGGDYGWRAVTRAWPPYDPDVAEAAPPNLDIGKGSPTGVKFGVRSRFPPRYQRALFILDWAYGRILAVHMTPRGASYAMRAEAFLKGRPFNVTDLDFGPDGALYVVTGGRKTQSGLYRILYVGKQIPERTPTRQEKARVAYSSRMRKVRARLEAKHRRDPAALDLAWPYLDSPDPFLRQAARIAVEHQPLAQWRKRTLAEDRPRAALTALLALVQGCPSKDYPSIVSRLGTFPLQKLPIRQQLMALRVYEIVLSRATPDGQLGRRCLKRLDPLYPAANFAINKPLGLLLVQLKAPGLVERTLPLLRKANSQQEQFQYISMLRNVQDGWSLRRREEYFRWIARMRRFVGGEGMPTFISRIQAEATAHLSPAERERLAPLLARKVPAIEIPKAAQNREFVRTWKVEELVDSLSQVSRKRNFDKGKKLFLAAACAACHRIHNTGQAIGPDLTSVGRRFSRRDILESIVHPDKVVAEQYRQDVIYTTDGKVTRGLVLQGSDYRSPELLLLPDPLKPHEVKKIHKKQIDTHQKAKTSIMPGGLLNTLTREEILDLLAYLEAGGDPKHPNYRK